MVRGRTAPWSRAQRTRVIDELLRMAMIEIRAMAVQPDLSRHPDGSGEHIRALADVCHRLPGAAQPQPAGEYDALVWTWQVANEFQRKWLMAQLKRLDVDIAFLVKAPRLPRPATAPDTRPTWRRWQLPRDAGEFKALDTSTLLALVHGAWELDPPGGAARQAFLEWMHGHVHPHGRHILRASRIGETMFVPNGPDDLVQHRVLLTMCDGALIVDHPRLRAGAVEALPARLNLLRRLQLAAVPRRSQERDAGLWARDHRAAHPMCPDWTASAGEAATSINCDAVSELPVDGWSSPRK